MIMFLYLVKYLRLANWFFMATAISPFIPFPSVSVIVFLLSSIVICYELNVKDPSVQTHIFMRIFFFLCKFVHISARPRIFEQLRISSCFSMHCFVKSYFFLSFDDR